jgi:hypothetical protein
MLSLVVGTRDLNGLARKLRCETIVDGRIIKANYAT